AYASSSAGSTEGTLLPGESATYTGSYTVTQDDVDAGGVWNQAIATVEVPEGVTPLDPAPSTPDENNPGKPGDTPYDPTDPDSPDHRTEVPAEQVADLTFLKEASLGDTNGNTKADKDEVITYTFTVTNTGTVTLSDVEVTDGLPNIGAITFDAAVSDTTVEGTLLPGESSVYRATYTVTQDDVDAGGVWNQAIATVEVPEGVTPLEPTPSTPDENNPGKPGDTPYDPTDPDSPDNRTEVPAEQIADLTFLKEASLGDTNGNTKADKDEVITYTFTVKNTGTVTLS